MHPYQHSQKLIHPYQHTVRNSYTYIVRNSYTHTDILSETHTLMQADPRHLMLVHGEAAKMQFLRQKVVQEFGIHCHMPANGEMVTIATSPVIPVDMSRVLLKRALEQRHGN